MNILTLRSAQIGGWGTQQGQGRLTEKQIITRQSDYRGDGGTEGIVIFGHTRKALKKTRSGIFHEEGRPMTFRRAREVEQGRK